MQSLLKRFGLEEFQNILEKEKITKVTTFALLKDNDIKSIGITAMGDIIKFREARKGKKLNE